MSESYNENKRKVIELSVLINITWQPGVFLSYIFGSQDIKRDFASCSDAVSL